MQRQQAKEGIGMIGSLAILSVKVSKFRKMRVRFHTVKQSEPDQELLAKPLHFHHCEKAVTTKGWHLQHVNAMYVSPSISYPGYQPGMTAGQKVHFLQDCNCLIPFPLFCVLLPGQWSETWLHSDLHPRILNHDLTNHEKLPGKVKNEIYPMEGQQYVPGLED